MIDTGKTGEFRYPVRSTYRDQDDVEFGLTPSQTVGPYVHIGLEVDGTELLVDENDPNAVEVTFSVFDGDGAPIADAMVEIWQADQDGKFNTDSVEGFRGLGRAMADETGTARFVTVVPGGYEGEAPHLLVGVFARGILERLYTRLYFPEDTAALETDPVLSELDASRRPLLIAEARDGGYHLDIRLQDTDPAKETPFFSL
ncbi:protocatechuate 3,4-dioxygenase subunit alpha [Corynebacterium riegelii]|uniref:protocatechuate 3,4-dioxygenase subunit alpha n=1 Tax=Corynebacterium riegelii TaxID=156976 RepID=UPI00288B7875|nr:protocatechuate 3,4-dioxygenase subunit alpha [Corynebacterium riegelii]